MGSPSRATSAPEPRSSTSGQLVATRDRGELVHPRLLREADLPEVGLVDAKQERRLRADRRLVVGGARAVRRPDFPEAGTGAGEDVGDAKAVADLDQLAARDEHLAPVGERGEGEQHGACVVVDHQRALRACEPPQETGQMMLTRAARTLGEVILQIRVAEGDTGDAVDGRLGERGAAEVRVHQHARGVQDTAELRPADRLELGERPVDEVSGVEPALISSRARSSAVRAASSTAARGSCASRSSRSSSSTEGRSRSLMKPSVSREACLTIDVLRRIRLAVTAVIVLVAGTAVTAVAARDAYYVDRPLPGVTVREARLAQPVTVVVDGRRVEVAPGRVLRIYRSATERSIQEAGRHSFLTRVQALADPSPPAIHVDPVLIVRPGEMNRLADELAAELQKPTAAQVVMRGVEPHVVPASPGQGIDRVTS